MPSSLIIVALVVAWLLVLVPIVARRRQEVAKTADSTLAARVVRSGGVRVSVGEEFAMSDSGDPDTGRETNFMSDTLDDDLRDELDELDGLDEDDLDEFEDELDDENRDDSDELDEVEGSDEAEFDDAEYDDSADESIESPDGSYDDSFDDSEESDDEAEYDDEYADYADDSGRPYRPGRGGFDPEAAALTARARYAFRQRVVVFMLVLALVTALVGGFIMPMVWWAHVVVDLTLISYLTYLRRQVRIEQEIRDRRTARLGGTRRVHVQPQEYREEPASFEEAPRPPVRRPAPVPAYRLHPGTVVVEADDEDPMFDELDEPDVLPYRRAVGE
ncbi:MAG TPA: gephyrin-like molybdotransferase receptor GlpR [Pseudonocardiaceae bacterium]|nr:gephyrin-like molybdotransferase receptor GlpR [Pseudonocardiaceae bacterium]